MMDPEFRVPTRCMYGVRMQASIWQQSSPVETDGEVVAWHLTESEVKPCVLKPTIQCP